VGSSPNRKCRAWRASKSPATRAWPETLSAGCVQETVLLVAGAEHVKRDRGIPLFWPEALAQQAHVVWMRAGAPHAGIEGMTDAIWATPPTPERDHCAELARPR